MEGPEAAKQQPPEGSSTISDQPGNQQQQEKEEGGGASLTMAPPLAVHPGTFPTEGKPGNPNRANRTTTIKKQQQHQQHDNKQQRGEVAAAAAAAAADQEKEQQEEEQQQQATAAAAAAAANDGSEVSAMTDPACGEKGSDAVSSDSGGEGGVPEQVSILAGDENSNNGGGGSGGSGGVARAAAAAAHQEHQPGDGVGKGAAESAGGEADRTAAVEDQPTVIVTNPPPLIIQHDDHHQAILSNADDVDSTQSDPLPETSSPAAALTKKESAAAAADNASVVLESTAVAASAMIQNQQPHRSAVSVDGVTPTPAVEAAAAAAVAAVAASPPHPSAADDEDDEQFDDYIRSPEVQNAIVERSPGGRYVRFMEKLGSGASKDVYRAYDTQEGIEVAWNVVNLSGVPKMERNRIVNEVRLLERLHHHNIISFHGSWVNRERQEVNFVTEILSSGTLKSFIAKVQVIRWKIAKRWAVQILKGLEYLHSQEPPVIHRDLKCENIFINGTSGDLRIGDLGLSTVHRNGRVLSVLGTPEFMAPDMYEESSYDERVDIYAFGMCMLEIFTKEIPYRECQNPAQIYKKVSNGEPPEVLSRLQSRHAREFVLLCLGYRDENGRYVRPSATELLQHPFLVKRANEDDEVVVDPPLRERVITEEPSSSSIGTPTKQFHKDASKAISGSPSQGRSEQLPERSTPPPRSMADRKPSLDEDLSDKFDEMPQMESNMKRVKVMMGRGQELEEDDSPPPNAEPAEGSPASDGGAGSASVPVQTVELPPPHHQQQQQQQPSVSLSTAGDFSQAQNSTPPLQHYLVAAAVLQNEGLETRPYPDDVLKLVVTLPVEGQTQNVQFDFHLVQDDPVQVAKEMVQELGIPMGAVLEISETISGLARSARMRVDTFYSRRKQSRSGNVSQNSAPQQGMMQHQQSQQHIDPSQVPHQHQQHDVSQFFSSEGHPVQTEYPNVPQQQQQQQQQGHISDYSQRQQAGLVSEYSNSVHHHAQAPPQASHQPPQQQQQQQQQGHTPEYSNGVLQNASASAPQQQPGLPAEHGMQIPTQPANQHTHMYVQHQGMQYGNSIPSQHQQQTTAQQQQPSYTPHQTPVQGSQAPTPPPPLSIPPQGQQGSAASQMHAPQVRHPDHLVYGQQVQPQPQQQHSSGSHTAIAPQQQQQQGMNFQPGSSQALAPQQQGSTQGTSSQHPRVQVNQPQSASSSPTAATTQNPPSIGQNAPAVTSSLADGGSAPNAPVVGAPPAQVQPSAHARQSTSPELNSVAYPKPAVVQRARTSSTVSGGNSPENSGHRRRQLSFSNSPEQLSSTQELPGEESNDPDMDAELRKLDEDFQRNLQRAKKVFDNRMDNLQRSQYEREAQHRKTLEKHEKERAEFEKRLAQEAEQQNRRIEQLQREWDKRRETLALQKRSDGASAHAGANGIHTAPSAEPAPAPPQPPPAAGTVQRTNSNSNQTAAVAAAAATAQAEYNHQQADANGGNER